jgi:hypothetical protein
MIFPTIRAHNHKLRSLPRQGSFHSITLHYALFHSAGRSTPAAIVVLACAVVRAAGCHVFCTTHCSDTPPAPFNNQHTLSKKTRQPLFGACLFPDTCFRCWHFLIVRTALIRSSYVLLAHTLPPARGLTSGRPLRSPWRLAITIEASAHHSTELNLNQ